MSRSRTPLYAELSSLLESARNLKRRINARLDPDGFDVPPHQLEQWYMDRCNDLRKLVGKFLRVCPQIQGLVLDVDASLKGGLKIVFRFTVHHDNETVKPGVFSGYTNHVLTVTPSFGLPDLHISGRNVNKIKKFLFDEFRYQLEQDVWEDEDGEWHTDMNAPVSQRVCPECGENTLRYIETVDNSEEIKHIYNADCKCDVLVYVIRTYKEVTSDNRQEA